MNSLTLLNTLINNYNQNKDLQKPLKKAIENIELLLNESDLQVTQLLLVLLTSTAKYRKNLLNGELPMLLPGIEKLVYSPLLQGAVLDRMLELFQELVRAKLPGFGYQDFYRFLRPPLLNQTSIHKQVFLDLLQ